MMPIIVRFLALLLCLPAPAARSEDLVLTTAHDVLALPADRAAEGLAATIEGVVTVAQPDWGGRFFMQDSTAGIFVDNAGGPQPRLGDLIRVTGVSHPGGFAPIITTPRWEKLGTAPLPEAKPVPIERLMSGVEDSQRIEVSGTLRTVRVDEFAIVFYLVSGGYRLQAILPLAAVKDPESLVGAKVRLRGTAAAAFKPELRQVQRMNLFVPLADDLIIVEKDPNDPFLKDPRPISKLAQYDPRYVPGQRIMVRGTVTYHRPGEDVFITDTTGGLQVRTAQSIKLAPGTVVETVGFPESEDYLPILQDAEVRPTSAPPAPIAPKPVDLEELRKSYHHADLVTLNGKVVDSMIRATNTRESGPPQELVTLTIQASGFVFTAEGPATESNAPLTGIPLGSTVELTGICMVRVADDAKMQSLKLLLPTVESVRIVRSPSWLTPKRLLTGLALLTGILVVALAWSVTVSRKNLTLTTVISDKVKAQKGLQEANDLLEERVEERTAQLQFEMNERKEAEVRFKATLAERTRLAQELHDTTEQSLTGIGLQLDTAAKLFESDRDAAGFPLETARTLMSQSHLELRQSIWDLRSRELEQFDLADALELSARKILQDTDVHVEFKATGPARPLSEVLEENLLRINREAIANVIKHAGAHQVDLHLEFGPDTVTLRITDDGRGFLPAEAPGPGDGHFGLLGMSERAKRLDGTLHLASTPEQGTLIEVKIPIAPVKETIPHPSISEHP